MSHFSELTTPEALTDVIAAIPAGKPSPSVIAKLSKQFSPELIRVALEQRNLRERAKAKFVDPENWFFVAEALEQASHHAVATYHASRFPKNSTVYDMTTGIGADLQAIARRGPAVGFELDPGRAQIARWNTQKFSTVISVGDSLALLPHDAEFAFADPARRVEGRRTLDPNDFAPNPVTLARRFAGLKLGLIKLTPLLPDEFLQSLGRGVAFVSFGGECREALIECGEQAEEGVRALHLETNEVLPESTEQVRSQAEPGEWVYDADPASVRAHALGNFGMDAIGDHPGYLTSEELVESPWLKGFRTLEFGKWHAKDVRASLRHHGVEKAVLKQRGAGLNLDEVRKELKVGHEGCHAILFYRVDKSIRWVLGERVTT